LTTAGDQGLQVVGILSLRPVFRPPLEDVDQFVPVSVKWFNRSEGYGFAGLTSEGPDSENIFLQLATLRRGGMDAAAVWIRSMATKSCEPVLCEAPRAPSPQQFCAPDILKLIALRRPRRDHAILAELNASC
jgi:hypothetical protein